MDGQEVMYGTCAVNSFINKDPYVNAADAFYMVGVPSETKQYQLDGMEALNETRPEGECLQFDTVRDHVEDCMATPIPFEQYLDPDDPTEQARLLYRLQEKHSLGAPSRNEVGGFW